MAYLPFLCAPDVHQSTQLVLWREKLCLIACNLPLIIKNMILLHFNFFRKEEPKTGSNKWINVFYDPIASINTFSQCMTLADINADGDAKLVIADLGTDTGNIKLKVFKGKEMNGSLWLLFHARFEIYFY